MGADWNDLQYFLAVAREQTLAAASRRLKVVETTVGRRLQALEAALGARLFDRTPDGLVLTAAGERILDAAVRAEEAMHDVERRVAGEDERLEGAVRLATSETLAAAFLVRELAPFRARHPGILLEVIAGANTVNLLKREADLAVRVTPRPQQANLLVRKLSDMAWALYATPAFLTGRRVEEDLRELEVAGFDESMQQLPAARFLEGSAARHVLRTNSILALHQACVAGFGLVPLPCLMGDVDEALVRARPEPIAMNECWLLVHPDLERTARVRALMDHFADVFGRLGPLLRGERPRKA